MKKRMIGGAVSLMLLAAAGVFAVRSMLPAIRLETPEAGTAAQLQAEDALQETAAQYEAELQEKDAEIIELKEQLAALSEAETETEETSDAHPERADVAASTPEDAAPVEEAESQAFVEEVPPLAPVSPQPQAESVQPLAVEEDLPSGAVFSFEASSVGGARGPSSGAPQENRVTEPAVPEWTPPEPELVDLDAYAQEVLALTNARREAAGLNTLSADPVLTEMAMLRAKELEESYSHNRPSGENCKTVFGEFEIDLKFYGENAAKGNRTPEAAVEAWMDSPGHRENLLREDAGYLGVGVWQDEDGILYWVQIFAIE